VEESLGNGAKNIAWASQVNPATNLNEYGIAYLKIYSL